MQIRRQKYHKQLRRGHIESTLKMERMRLIQGKSLFIQVNQRIQSQSSNPSINTELISQLIHLLKYEENEENTYILVGNYLIDHPKSHSFFEHYLIENPKPQEHYLWVLYLLTEVKINSQQMTAIDILNISTACEHAICSDWKYFLGIFQQLLELQLNFEHFPLPALSAFNHHMIGNHFDHFKESTKEAVSKICILMANNYISIDQYTQIEQFISVLAKPIQYTLSRLPHCRQECIKGMLLILDSRPSLFSEYLLNQPIITELLYLLEQTKTLRVIIVSLLMRILNVTRVYSQIAMFLQAGVHSHLVRTLDWALQACELNCVEQCLSSIYALLGSVKEEGEPKMLERVIFHMEIDKFSSIIEHLLAGECSKTHELAIRIADDYYTEEI